MSLDDRARRMLYRMTFLRVPWTWDLLPVLGEPDEPPDVTEATAERLRSTSLLEQVDLPVMGSEERIGLVRYFTLHPATVQFITQRFGEETPLRLATHRRVGTYYEARAKTSPYIEDDIEAGHHLFQAGEYDRSYDMLGPASDWLQDRGRVREGLQALEPFLAEPVRAAMTPDRVGRLLGTVGLRLRRLGPGGEGDRLLRAGVGDRTARSATGGARGTPSATWASPTPTWARWSRRSASTSRRWRSRARSATAKARGRPRQPGPRLRRPGPGGAGDRLLRAGLGDRARDRRPAGREHRPRQPGQRLRRLGPGGAGDRPLRTALAIDREIGDRRGEGNVLGNLGIAYAALGQVEQAIGLYEQRW